MHAALPDDFASYPQPPWNTEGSVEAAIGKLIMAASEEDAVKSCEALLNALGNNHAGTYYPVALATIQHLGFQVEWGSPWAQHAAVQVLIELTGSFEPELGYEAFVLPGTESQVYLRRELRLQVRLLLPALRNLAAHVWPASGGAHELIELMGSET